MMVQAYFAGLVRFMTALVLAMVALHGTGRLPWRRDWRNPCEV